MNTYQQYVSFFWQHSCSLTHNVLPSITVLLLLILVLFAVSCVSSFTFHFFPRYLEAIWGSYFSKVRSSVANFVAKSGKGAVQGAVQAAVQWWRGLAKVPCRLLCRLLSRVRLFAVAVQAVQSAVLLWGGKASGCCPECGDEVWQRCCAACCAGCCPKCSGEGAAQAVRCRSLAKVLCRVLRRLLSTARGHCIVKDFVGLCIKVPRNLLRNLLQNLVELDPAPAPVHTGAILGWRPH